MINTADTQNRFLSFSLPQTSLPKFVEKTNKDWVSAGADNKWFTYLIELANASALHGAIIKSVIEQVKGQGVRIKEETPDEKLSVFINSVNRNEESLDDVLSKVITDYILFGGFSLSNVWNKGKTGFELYHTDLSLLRSGKSDATGNVNEYYFSNNWEKNNNATITPYSAFEKDNRSGTQIYYYKPYCPGFMYYPLPEYISVIPWAEVDAKVAEFHNANLDNGCFPSLFINYANGVPSKDRQDEIYEDLMNDFEGSSKAGKIFLNFSNGQDTAAVVTPLNANESDKKFTELANLVLQQILQGHRIVSPELVGISIPGKLGNQQIMEAQELYFNICIKPKIKVITDEINYLLQCNGFTGQIEIIPSQPVSFSLSEDSLIKVCTGNEIREMIGRKPLPDFDHIVESGNKPATVPQDTAPLTEKSETTTTNTQDNASK